MANDGTLNQRETGVGIFDQMTFQNDTPIFGYGAEDSQAKPAAENEEVSQQAHDLAYGGADSQPEPEMTDSELQELISQQETLDANAYGTKPEPSQEVLAAEAAATKAQIEQENLTGENAIGNERLFNDYSSGPYADPAAGYDYEATDSEPHPHADFYNGDQNKTLEDWQAEKVEARAESDPILTPEQMSEQVQEIESNAEFQERYESIFGYGDPDRFAELDGSVSETGAEAETNAEIDAEQQIEVGG